MPRTSRCRPAPPRSAARNTWFVPTQRRPASTLSVVNAVHEALKTTRAAAPPGLEITELFDQSVFVKRSIAGVLREGAIAAGLTALMILLFLGSWRSTLV